MIAESRAVILARVSSKSQEDEGYSLDSQLKLLEAYCLQRELTVVKVFKIAETASKQQSRKVFHEMLGYIKKEKVFHVAVEKTDRLTRNFRDAVAIDDWLEKDDRRKLHAVKENLQLHKNARSDVKFMWNIHLSVAKKYSDNLREEAMKGWAEKLAQGWLPASPPIGYMTVVEHGKRIHVPDPSTAPLVRQLFEKYLEPNHSVASMAQEMQKMGLTTRSGRPYHKSKVHAILTNPFYIGINRFDSKDYPGLQQHLIDKALFNQVQQKLHCKSGTRYSKHNPVFKNLIHCGECSGVITWQLQKGFYYGTCQRTTEACKKRKWLRQDIIEKQITEMLTALVCPSEDVIEWVAEAMQQRHKDQKQRYESVVESVQAQLSRIERMLSNLYDDKLSGEITHDMYDSKRTEILRERTDLQEKLEQAEHESGLILQKKLALLKLSQKAAALYPKKSVDHKRTIITKLFADIEYKEDSLLVKYTNFTEVIADKVRKTYKLTGGKI